MKGKINCWSIGLIYVGTIMGAGFASGRELWQFFGLFGEKGFWGLGIVTVLFSAIGITTAIIGTKLKTNNLGKIIVPGDNKYLKTFVNYFMSLVLFTVLITMSAAGGSLLNQLFGANQLIGGIIIVSLVVVTILKGFEKMSKVFQKIMPLLVGAILLSAIFVLFSDGFTVDFSKEFPPSPLAKSWWLSGILYVSYNVLSIIPIMATAANHAINRKHAVLGSIIGSFLLVILAITIFITMETNPEVSDLADMPMVALITAHSETLGLIYSMVLFFAIYASATGNYYGFCARLNGPQYKTEKIIAFGVLGLGLGLVGFKNVVAYMFPLEGFVGISIIILIVMNLIKITKDKDKDKINEYN